MAKSLTEIRSLARSHTRSALNVLVRVMRSKDATAAAKVSAANAILDRGWGKPMPSWITPLPLGGLLNNSNASGNNDWFNFLAGLALQNPTRSAPLPPQSGGKPERSLGRRIVDPSQASAVDTRAPAAPLAPSDDPNFSGGLLGRFAALAGVDPQNPNQPAPPPLDDEQEQADMRALDARLSRSGNIRDAVALYNARKSSRR
jgi:hypothetical protein